MTRRDMLILRSASLWTVWIWGTRILNIMRNPDHSTSFKAVHTALALVSVAFAVAIWVIAGKGGRRQQNDLAAAEASAGGVDLNRPV